MNHLKPTYNITAFDLLGQAGSGRPRFDERDPYVSIMYMNLSIEAWMAEIKYRE
jgi:hypothetical protein